MKRGILIYFALATTCLAQGNLLRNPGFLYASDGSLAPDPAAQHWTSWGQATRETWGAQDNDGHLASVHNSGGTSGSGGWFQDVAGFHYTRYHFSGYLCADPGHTSAATRLKIEFFDAAKSVMVGAVTSEIGRVGATWSYHEVEGESPADAVYVRVVLEAVGQGTNGTLKFDHAQLLALPANRLGNGGFLYAREGDTNENSAAQRWHQLGHATREHWGSHDDDGYLAVLQNWNGDQADGYWYQDVEGEPGARYQLAGYFCIDAGYSASVSLKIEFFDINRDPIGTVSTPITGLTGDWSLREVGGTAPTNTWWMRAVVGATGQGTAGSLKIDHLRLVGSSPNCLLNPGFLYAPDGSTVTNPAAQNWSRWGEASREYGNSHEGDHFAATIHNWSNAWAVGGWFQDVPGLPRLRYELEGWIQADAGYVCDSVDLKLEFYDYNWNWLTTEVTEVTSPPSSWGRFTLTAASPPKTARIRAVLAASGQGTNGQVKVDDLRVTSEPVPGLQRLEPAEGAYTGNSLDWTAGDAVGFNTLMGWDNAIHGEFIGFPMDYHWVDSHLSNCQQVGAMYYVTPCPGTLADATTNNCEAFAEWCREWNEKGVPILVRFGHEMNGYWAANWGGMRPAQFRRAFRLLADSLHRIATNTATVWAPYCAQGYPGFELDGISKADYTNGFGTLEDWCLIDTDGNGILRTVGGGGMDDPYDPFYPGDDYVDWIGLSSYHWGWIMEACSCCGWNGFRYNTYPDPRQFSDEITGNLSWSLWVPNIYRDYSEGRGKPLLIAETSAAYRPADEIAPEGFYHFTNDEAHIKSVWIKQLYHAGGDDADALDVVRHFQKMKAVCWFDFRKEEPAACGDTDWRISANGAVRTSHLERVNTRAGNSRYWLRADDVQGLVYDWNSSLEGWVPGGAPFNAYVTTDAPFERRGCVRLDYDGSSSAGDKVAMADYWALPDARGWGDFDAIYLRAKVPPGTPFASFRLVFQSAETGWDILGTEAGTPDGAWHTLVFPYDWSRHDASSWLNFYLQVDLSNGVPASVYVDALEAAADYDTDGLPDADDPDDDNDGMPDSYEDEYALNARDASDADAHYDGDGATNYEESRMNTNPWLDDSVLRLLGVTPLFPDDLGLSWEGRAGVTYQFQRRASMTGSWDNCGDPIPAAAHGTLLRTNDCLGPQGFFRLVIP